MMIYTVYAVLLAMVLSVDGGFGMRYRYKKNEVKNVAIRWKDSIGFQTEKVNHAGYYSFYEDVQGSAYYVQLKTERDQCVTEGNLRHPDPYGNQAIYGEIKPLNPLPQCRVLCIGKRDNGEMIRSEPRGPYRATDRRERSSNDDNERVATIVWVVIAIVIFACFGGFVWFMIHLKKRNQRAPQQFQVYQQPMPIYTNPQPMMMQPQQTNAAMTNQQIYAVPSAPQM